MTNTQTPSTLLERLRTSELPVWDPAEEALHAGAEAAVMEQHPTAFRCVEDKRKAWETLAKKKINIEKQIRDCQQSLDRLEVELEERFEQLNTMDTMIAEAIALRMNADEMRPDVLDGLAEHSKRLEASAGLPGKDPEKSKELIRDQKHLAELDAEFATLSTRVAKIYYNR